MSLNKQKGNMFSFISHTWNPIKGKCQHLCSYCYMAKMYKKYKWDERIRLDEKCLKDNLGSGNKIFVGSSTDMFQKDIPHSWISDVFAHCNEYDNIYLFQSKNSDKFGWFKRKLPKNIILATTIETNRQDILNKYTKAPDINSRIFGMQGINNKKYLTIEPIMDFDIDKMIDIVEFINPFQINIGADSGHNNLPEPEREKVIELMHELQKNRTVHIKDTLQRIIK